MQVLVSILRRVAAARRCSRSILPWKQNALAMVPCF